MMEIAGGGGPVRSWARSRGDGRLAGAWMMIRFNHLIDPGTGESDNLAIHTNTAADSAAE